MTLTLWGNNRESIKQQNSVFFRFLNYRIVRNFRGTYIFRGLASKSHFVAQCSRNDCLPEATPLNLCMFYSR